MILKDSMFSSFPVISWNWNCKLNLFLLILRTFIFLHFIAYLEAMQVWTKDLNVSLANF